MAIIFNRKCNKCGKQYKGYGKFFCSLDCAWKGRKLNTEGLSIGWKMAKNRKGKKFPERSGANHPLWGKKMSDETKGKISKTRTKKKVGMGSSNPNWKGGITGDINKYYRKYTSEKCNIDPSFKLRILLRNRLRFALKSNQKKGSAVRDLGCTIPELRLYLESLFKEGMDWGNWSFFGWHIDHKIPLSSFDLTQREQFLEACHYTNLQPMWWMENIKKGGNNKKNSNVLI